MFHLKMTDGSSVCIGDVVMRCEWGVHRDYFPDKCQS